METIKYYKKEIKWRDKEIETLSGRCRRFAIEIGKQRERANKYWKRAIEAENKLKV